MSSLKLSTPIKRFNVVIDLDETLIKCIRPYQDQDLTDLKSNGLYLCDFKINTVLYCIMFRPHMFDCLKSWSGTLNIYIYTNSVREYCNQILEGILQREPDIKICGICCRESKEKPMQNKDLCNLKISPKNSVIIDDNIKIWNQRSNVMNIKTFMGPTDSSQLYAFDDELLKIDRYLKLIVEKSKVTQCMVLQNHTTRITITRTEYRANEVIDQYNSEYRSSSWIYDGCTLLTITFLVEDGKNIKLKQPPLQRLPGPLPGPLPEPLPGPLPGPLPQSLPLSL
jgi:hypothetical protein